MTCFPITLQSLFAPCDLWGEPVPKDSDTIRASGFITAPIVDVADVTSTVKHDPSTPLIRHVDNDDTAGFCAELGRRAWRHRANEE